MEPGLLIFLSLVGFTGFGVLWFYVLEPALTGLGIIRADSAAKTDDIMSSDDDEEPADDAPSAASERQTDRRQTADRPRVASPEALRNLRQHGYSREDARLLLRLLDYPLDNNAWAQVAAPPPAAQGQPVTPWGGRPYDPARYHQDDPELHYQPLEE